MINSVQESIAGELDQQAIYDLVGEKLREVFDAQVVDIAIHDEDAGLMRFVYQIERGVHFPNVTFPVMGFRKHVMETREPLAIHENMDAALVEYGNPAAVAGEPRNGSAIFQPLVVGGRATGVDLDPEPRPRARLQPVGPAAARDDRRQPRRRARERAADPRDEAARRRARDGEQRRPGARDPARPRRADPPRRRARPRDVRRGHRLRRPARRGRRRDRVSLQLGAGRAHRRAADAVRRGPDLADHRVGRAAPRRHRGPARDRPIVGTPSQVVPRRPDLGPATGRSA